MSAIEAGSVTNYSNQAIEALTEALARFSKPKHPEKTLEELERLLERVQEYPRKNQSTPVTHIQNAERRLGDAQVADMLARYASGLSASSVGREFGIGAATVMRLARKHGLQVHDRRPSVEVVQKAAELYQSGLSVQRVADELGVPKSTLLRELKAAGVVMRQFKPQASAPRLRGSDQGGG